MKLDLEKIPDSNNHKKVWVRFDNKWMKDMVWANREAVRRQEVFYLDEFLSMEERRVREHLVRIGKRLRKEGKTVEIENKRIWVAGSNGGEWHRWDYEKEMLVKVGDGNEKKEKVEKDKSYRNGGVKREWREERGERGGKRRLGWK